MSEAFVSLKPLGGTDGDFSLRPSNAVFSKLRKGAGASLGGLRQKTPAFAQAIPEPEQPKKPPGQIIRYGKEFLLQFMDRYVKCPLELQALQLEIVISEDTERETQRQALKQVAEEDADDRDWRSRTPLAEQPAGAAAAAGAAAGAGAAGAAGGQQGGRGAAAGGQQQQQQQQSGQQQQAAAQQQQRQPPSQEALRIHKAEEQGRQAYRVGATLGAQERALRAVKGILNKLTPEKYERLLAQLLEVVTTADLLKQTISLVFENAVAQPTFCAMYADLCSDLGKELPSFPPAEGESKPITFRRVLLNTCQDEFEAAADARRELAGVSDADERAAAERRVKSRTLGTVRLIAELFRKEVVQEAIIVVCIRELLEAAPNSKDNIPPEDNIEAACEMISITGKLLDTAGADKSRKALDGYLARLTRLGSDDKNVASRLRFLIRDVLDMKRNKWVPRRETFTAKKLEEVHAEAEAELGIVSSKIASDLPALPGQARATADEFALLPPLRGGDMGWEYVGRKGASRNTFGPGANSALVGDYTPPEPLQRQQQQQAAAAAAPEPSPAAAAGGRGAAAKPKAQPMGPEDIANRTKGFLREFVSIGDLKEAKLCLSELREAPKTGGVTDLRGVVEAATQELFDAQSDKAATALLDLLVGFIRDGLLTTSEVVGGLQPSTSTLGDLALDVPKAPELLGRLVGSAAAACSSSGSGGSFSLAALGQLLQGAEGAEAKRAFGVAVFKAYAAGAGGSDKLAEAVKASGLKGEELFAADEFDGDLPSVTDWLKAEGFSSLGL